MINNIFSTEELGLLARKKKQAKEYVSVSKSKVEKFQEVGWDIQKEYKTKTRLFREKRKEVLLEDRVWTLLHKMGFPLLSGEGGAKLFLTPGDPKSPFNQIDVVGVDKELALAVECKSAGTPRKKSDFQKDIAKFAVLKKHFRISIDKQFPQEHTRALAFVMFTWDLLLADSDYERAKHEKIFILNENDLHYYEQLVNHLGPAARYQFYADILSDRKINGLEVKVPALKSKMGKSTYYSFSISPEHLLKIAYVSHRAKGKATDVDTYQRMIKKSRLRKIKIYISDYGVFPTNIVVNFETNSAMRFEASEQKGGLEGAKYGTLFLPPKYGAAWIIDGQHRLFAYSGHERAEKSFVNVLAFDGLPPSEQAQMFIDINHEQKSVKRSLLQELYAELNWDAEDENKRVGAIVSKTIQALVASPDSPFFNRILLTDATRTVTRCISLESMFKALSQHGMFIVKNNIEYGPLWAGENDETLKRTIKVIKAWFTLIREGAEEWWDLGADEGGGLAMNDGITICTGVLRSVFDHLKAKGYSLVQFRDEELIDAIKPFGEALGEYFASLTNEERKALRSGSRGVQGQTAGRRQCEAVLNTKFPDFEPKGLKEFLELQKARTNERAYASYQRIENMLRDIVLSTLKNEFKEGDDWWYIGVPPEIRKRISERIEDEQGKHGGRENNFDFIHYRKIALKNWSLFQGILSFGKGNKEKKTEWIGKINDMRKVITHAKGRVISWNQLSELQDYEEWLKDIHEWKED
jgi:DGQHR domain-containing protein